MAETIKSEYLEIVRRLPIETPSEEDIIALMPHLKPAEALGSVFQPRIDVPSFTVAIPSFVVRNAAHILRYRRSSLDNSSNTWQPDSLDLAGFRKTSGSYSSESPFKPKAPDDQNLRWGRERTPVQHFDRAIEFANSAWGDDLTADNWIDYIEWSLRRPNPQEPSRPIYLGAIYLTTNREVDDIKNDRTRPLSELFQDHLNLVTHNHVFAEELKAGRLATYLQSSCGDCGAGIHQGHCPECEPDFEPNRFLKETPSSAVPEVLANYLDSLGIEFKIPTAIAREKERTVWLQANPNLGSNQ